MIYETRINLRNKTKEELILFVNEGLETISKYETELKKKDEIIDLMVEDFQNEGYLKGMSREEILDYYQKRLWLNKQRNPLPLKLDITG